MDVLTLRQDKGLGAAEWERLWCGKKECFDKMVNGYQVKQSRKASAQEAAQCHGCGKSAR